MHLLAWVSILRRATTILHTLWIVYSKPLSMLSRCRQVPKSGPRFLLSQPHLVTLSLPPTNRMALKWRTQCSPTSSAMCRTKNWSTGSQQIPTMCLMTNIFRRSKPVRPCTKFTPGISHRRWEAKCSLSAELRRDPSWLLRTGATTTCFSVIRDSRMTSCTIPIGSVKLDFSVGQLRREY